MQFWRTLNFISQFYVVNKLVFYLMKQNVHMFKYKIKCSTAKCRGHKYLLTFRSRALYFVFEQLMEKLIFGYSFKNIPMSDNMTYNLKLIEKIDMTFTSKFVLMCVLYTNVCKSKYKFEKFWGTCSLNEN